MKHLQSCCSALLLATLLLGARAASAADAKGYQVTGPVVELTDTTITVDKSGEKFQIARTKGTKIDGDLKVGAKVTVYYKMTATDIEVKGDKKK